MAKKYLANIAGISLKTIGEKEVYQELKEFAKKRGLKMWYVILHAIKEYMENHKEVE